jgi:hypothetical protein
MRGTSWFDDCSLVALEAVRPTFFKDHEVKIVNLDERSVPEFAFESCQANLPSVWCHAPTIQYIQVPNERRTERWEGRIYTIVSSIPDFVSEYGVFIDLFSAG